MLIATRKYIFIHCSCFIIITTTMRISSRFLRYFKLDHSYSLLNCRNVSVLLEFFRALDVRGMMALDGKPS